MRTRLSAVALWLVATVLATAAVWAGTSAIGDAARSDTDLVVAPTTSGIPADAATTTTVAVPATTQPPTAPPGSGVPVTVAPATTPPPTTTTATAVPSLPALAEVRTYVLTGGTVTVRFTPDGVTVVLATPHPGFGADVEQRGTLAIRVEFESDDHRSRLDASWAGGPVDEVRED